MRNYFPMLLLSAIVHGLLASHAAANAAQSFGDEHMISSLVGFPLDVHAEDLDGDGDLDVISADISPSRIDWYENLGSGSFSPPYLITADADRPRSLTTADLDGDGDPDIIAASYQDNKVFWIQNQGSGSFGPIEVISTKVDEPYDVHAADLDNDGDDDILSASRMDNKIAWYENLGGGSFGGQQVISNNSLITQSVCAEDLDLDGDYDVLSASYSDDTVAWHENLGGGIFGPKQVLTTAADGASKVLASDLDGDGLIDVVWAGFLGSTIAWHKNLGGGQFAPEALISNLASCWDIHIADFDGDGESDILASNSQSGGNVSWYRNLGGGSFGAEEVISSVPSPHSVHAGDVDKDGDIDALSSADLNANGRIAWHENRLGDVEWLSSPHNSSWYSEVPPSNWINAEGQAVLWGGHLVTIRSQAENDWLSAKFAGDSSPFWIGYSDADVEGVFVWSSGETPGYLNWRTGEPDDLNGSDWAALVPSAGTWVDEPLLPERRGVAEVISGDCDGDGVPDVFESTLKPWLDWNGDGVLDSCVSANYCGAENNSTGVPAVIGASGSPIASENAFTLEAWDLPLNEFAYFLASESTAFIPGFGGSSGNLCLGAPQYRFNIPAGGGKILNSGATGTVSFTLDLNLLPQGITFDPGETWYFQLWYRDFTSVPTSNTTDGIEVMFR